MKKLQGIFITLLMLTLVFTGCADKAVEEVVTTDTTTTEATRTTEATTVEETTTEDSDAEIVKAAETEGSTLLLATTTSTRDSGLLDHIIGDFTEQTAIEVKVIAVGTGKALQMGRDGEADALLVHAKTSEEEFVAEGYGTERFDVMYNDFIVVGPMEDPADLKTLAPNDVTLGFKTLYDAGATFVSRGDDSGTNKKEISLWADAGIEFTDESFYVSAGKGMGDVLTMASEMQGYTLTDRATYLNMMDKLELEIVLEKDDQLFNQYGVIPVNPETNDLINNEAANRFVEWLLSEETQGAIGEYGIEKFGMPLFTPNAK